MRLNKVQIGQIYTALLHCSAIKQADCKLSLQDDVSSSGQAFAFGLTLEKLSAHTMDEDGKPTFAKHNPMELLRKVNTLFPMADNPFGVRAPTLGLQMFS